MMKKKIILNSLGGLFLLVSIVLFLQDLNPPTGAVIGINILENFNFIPSVVFFVVSILMFGLAKRIHTHYFVEGAREATGSVVIIDTYRGSSLISTLLGE